MSFPAEFYVHDHVMAEIQSIPCLNSDNGTERFPVLFGNDACKGFFRHTSKRHFSVSAGHGRYISVEPMSLNYFDLVFSLIVINDLGCQHCRCSQSMGWRPLDLKMYSGGYPPEI